MKKTRGFLLTAGVSLALAFTLSCTDGGGDDGGSNLSDLPIQVYLAGNGNIVQYKGNGDVSFIFSDIDTVPAGKIHNGQLSLTWPAVEEKYLRKFGNPCDVEASGRICQSTFSFPESLFGYHSDYLYVDNVPGKSYCRLRLYLIKPDRADRTTIFYYLSESGSVNGTYTTRYEYDIENDEYNYDWDYSEGWNVIYVYNYFSENGNDYTSVKLIVQ